MLQVSACNKVVSLKEQTDVESLVKSKLKYLSGGGVVLLLGILWVN